MAHQPFIACRQLGRIDASFSFRQRLLLGRPQQFVSAPSRLGSPFAHRALELSEIAGIIEDYRKAAQRAKDAGFDGVELHAANGYLPDQFLQDNSNKRTDQYGGPVQNRSRFLLEVVAAMVSVWGADRVGA